MIHSIRGTEKERGRVRTRETSVHWAVTGTQCEMERDQSRCMSPSLQLCDWLRSATSTDVINLPSGSLFRLSNWLIIIFDYHLRRGSLSLASTVYVVCKSTRWLLSLHYANRRMMERERTHWTTGVASSRTFTLLCCDCFHSAIELHSDNVKQAENPLYCEANRIPE